ncbi:response regulator [Natronospira sp.]|uniref:response regulator n=1 Tax=Natronospira sp. TaxID=2024970 RepID=UPI003873354C
MSGLARLINDLGLDADLEARFQREPREVIQDYGLSREEEEALVFGWPADESAGQMNRAHVLVVEDEPVNRDLMVEFLEMEGFSVDAAGDGEEALRYCRDQAPDIVLMDINLPILSGLEATRELRDWPSMTAVPVIAVSAQSEPPHRQAAEAAGCTVFEPKPVNFPRLLRLMQCLLLARRV